MPDICANYITGSEEDIRAVLDLMRSETSGFDFERIIPMPEILRKTIAPIQVVEDKGWDPEELNKPEIRTLSKSKHQEFIAQYGAADWRAWAEQHWGAAKPPFETGIEAERIVFTTPWRPPFALIKQMVKMLPPDVELEYKWVQDQGNGAKFEIAANELTEMEIWTAPSFEWPIDSVNYLRKCYISGGEGGKYESGKWYYEDSLEPIRGYNSVLEALIHEEIFDFDPEDAEIAEEFWEAYSPQDGLRILDHIEETVPNLTDDIRTLMQCARDIVPTQEFVVGPKA